MRTFSLLVLSLGVFLSACDPSSVASAEPDAPRVENRDVSIMIATERSAVSVWLSPRVDSGNDVPFRFVNIVYHSPGLPNAAGMTCRPVMPKAKGAVVYEDLGVKISVKPKDGRSWAEVTSREHLTVAQLGLP